MYMYNPKYDEFSYHIPFIFIFFQQFIRAGNGHQFQFVVRLRISEHDDIPVPRLGLAHVPLSRSGVSTTKKLIEITIS